MDNEVWKDIEGYEDFYQISNMGNVKSYDRIKYCPIKNQNGKILIKGHLLKLHTGTTGYKSIVLYKNKTKARFLIHRLVATAFIPNTFNERTVNHKDGDKSNNKVTNLEWLSYSDNFKHSYRVLNTKHSRAIPVDVFTRDLQFIKSFKSKIQAAKEIKCCTVPISEVCSGLRAHHKNLIFRLHKG